jgi:hypothetical protein
VVWTDVPTWDNPLGSVENRDWERAKEWRNLGDCAAALQHDSTASRLLSQVGDHVGIPGVVLLPLLLLLCFRSPSISLLNTGPSLVCEEEAIVPCVLLGCSCHATNSQRKLNSEATMARARCAANQFAHHEIMDQCTL